MSIADKLTTIAENEQKVYEAGKKAEWGEFWDAYQTNGERTNYTYAFFGARWNDTTFKPKYDIKPAGDMSNIFYNCGITDLKSVLEERGVTLDISGASSVYRAFAYSVITVMPSVTLPSVSSVNQLFYGCSKLKEIEELIVNENNGFTNAFYNCTELTKLIVSGTIAKNGFSVSNSTKLSVESLLSILNALKDYSEDTSGTSWVCTLGTTNLGKLSDEQNVIATEKGWTLA